MDEIFNRQKFDMEDAKVGVECRLAIGPTHDDWVGQGNARRKMADGRCMKDGIGVRSA